MRVGNSTWENPFGPRRRGRGSLLRDDRFAARREGPGRRNGYRRHASITKGWPLLCPAETEGAGQVRLVLRNHRLLFAHGGHAYAHWGASIPITGGRIPAGPVGRDQAGCRHQSPPPCRDPRRALGRPARGRPDGLRRDVRGRRYRNPQRPERKAVHPPRKESLARSIDRPNQALEQPVNGTTPKATPWRVLMVAPTPGRLIENNDLILNLNPPCAIADRPGSSRARPAAGLVVRKLAKNVPSPRE